MNLDQLGASFTQNRTAILGTAAAGVVGLALYRRKQAAAAPAAPTAGATTAGVYSAGGQTAGMYGANAYDSSASDVYGLVQPQLESLGGQLNDLNAKLNAVPVSQAPTSAVTAPPSKPIATTLFSPTRSGNYVRYGDQTITEVEQDGSQLALTYDQWVPIANGGGTMNYSQSPDEHPGGVVSRTNWNLNAVGQK